MRVSNNPLYNSRYDSNKIGEYILFFIFVLFSPIILMSFISYL